MELFDTIKREINNFINLYNQPLENQNIIVAVSCGVDSTVLLHVLEDLKNTYKYNIVIAHVNHGKREQSEIEEEYIRDYSIRQNINIEILKLNHDDFSGSNFQEEARIKRIQFFKDVMNKYNSKYLFLAHHLNDDAETIIMRLMRNSAINVLFGMNKVSIVNDNKNYYFIRPMLDVKKDDIYDYAKNKNYKYFEDSSNNTDDYTRNRIRHNLINDCFEDIAYSVKKYKENIGYIAEAINYKRDEFINNNVRIKNLEIEMKVSDLNKLSYDLRIDCLFELLKKYNYSKVNIEQIYDIIESSNNKITNYKDILIIREYNILKIKKYYKDLNDIVSINEFVIDGFGKFDIDDNHYIEVIKNENENNFNINVSNKDIIWYNESMLPFTIRKKMDGDRIKIKNGSKKVNDILTDLKIPASDRDKIMLLLDKNGDVISILGIRKSYLLNECMNRDLLIKTNYYNNL